MKAYVIADIGACHEGSLAMMQDAIAAAKRAGCDAIKFQWTSDPERMAARRGSAKADGYADIYAQYLTWPAEWLGALQGACQSAGIYFMCTVFLPEDVAVVAPHVRHFKIASFEADDIEMYAAYESLQLDRPKALIVSAGMGGKIPDDFRPPLYMRVALLHCVSSYPAPLEQMNLNRLCEGGYDGLSDHSKHPWMGALAVMAHGHHSRRLGWTIIEAHLKLETTRLANPDGPHAMTEAEFKTYVQNIRTAEKVLGTQREGMVACETKMMKYKVPTSGQN